MSSLFNQASLVLVPSGYKAGKVYSEVPTSGDGDLTFTRASDATRVNSDGLIEKVRTNLALYSEQFDNAYWNKGSGTVITANDTTAPDGTLSADRVQFTGSSWVLRGFPSGNYAGSIFIKGTAGESIRFGVGNNVAEGALFTLTGNWQRLEHIDVSKANLLVSNFGGATATDFHIWGAQFETGDIATEYIPTTTAAVSVGMTANVPRLDYSQGSCPALLLEPQRTNFVLYSEQFDNADWVQTRTTITSNTTTSPDGTTSADKFIPNTDANSHLITQTISSTTNAIVLSCFVKLDGSSSNKVTLYPGSSQTFANFNLSNLTSSGEANVLSTEIIDFGNGWYRLVASYPSGLTYNIFRIYNSSGTIGAASIAGNGTDGVFIWGAQVEEGAYATSYIPTTSASVTRLADTCSKTGISSLIGQQEGVIYWEGILPQASSNGASFNSNIFNTERQANTRTAISIAHMASTSTISVDFFTGNGTFTPLVTLTAASFAAGSFAKIAFAYKSGSFALYVNGVLKASSALTFTSITTMGQINLHDNVVYYGYTAQQFVKQLLIFPTRLTNAELAELTTL